MAEILGDNQIRRQSLQRLGIDGVQTFAAVHVLAHQPVNFRWRCIARQARMNHYALRPRLWREIALVAHAHDFAVQAQREENLRGRRQQRHNAHIREIYHIWGIQLLSTKISDALLQGLWSGVQRTAPRGVESWARHEKET